MKKQDFIEAIAQKGIDLSQEQADQFERYLQLLQEWNQKMNLTALDEEEQIWEKHFYDSLLPFLDSDFETLLDVGSGAGFPGIPLQIAYPDRKITLLEPLQKRCTFLNAVKDELQLDNLTIINERAEILGKEEREKFDAVSARAVARLPILLELTAPFARTGGEVIALKGAKGQEELEDSKKATEVLGLNLEKENEYELSGEKRTNFYFKKTKATPNKYPRAYGQIKKKPLGS